jgi:hypothetical protein
METELLAVDEKSGVGNPSDAGKSPTVESEIIYKSYI